MTAAEYFRKGHLLGDSDDNNFAALSESDIQRILDDGRVQGMSFELLDNYDMLIGVSSKMLEVLNEYGHQNTAILRAQGEHVLSKACKIDIGSLRRNHADKLAKGEK
jgi:hypothetical protein